MNREAVNPPEPKRLMITGAILMIFLIGYIDYWTGYDISLFVVYTVPIMLVVWHGDSHQAILIAVFCALVWWWADAKSGHLYFTNWGQIWEATVRLMFFVFVVIGGAAMKTKHDAIESRLEALSRTRELEREIVGASEREQQRIGQDLHDGLCQYLAAIGCAASALKEDLNEKFLPDATAAAEIEELLRDAVVQARNLARGIAPVHLDEAGLPSALRELAVNTARLTGIDCIFFGDLAAKFDNSQTATHLFRIAQEATNNAIKHSHATRVEISLQHGPDWLEVAVRDDGIGLPPNALRASGMGLKTMQYRSRLIHADLKLSSTDGGTLVACRLPASATSASDSVSTHA